MKLKIERISRKEVNTPNGKSPTAWKLSVLCDKVWYSCFAGDWNKDWKEQQVLDVEVKQNGQYWNILPPKRGGSSDVDDIKNALSQIMQELLALKALVAGMKPARQSGPEDDPPVPDDKDMPPEDDNENLPF